MLTLATWLSGKDAGTAKTAAGHHVCLDHLAELLDTGAASAVVETDASPLERSYGDAIAETSST